MVRYHYYYPSPSDPFYQYNISENMARARYYDPYQLPRLRIDGTSWVSSPSSETAIRDAINSRRAIASPCTIEVSTAIIGGDTIEATVHVTAEQDMHNANTRLFVALIHRCYEWNSKYYWYSFRDMEPDTLGQPFQLDADSTFEFVADFSTAAGWDFNDLSVVAFIQLYNTKQVLQAGFADVGESPPTLFINEFMANNTSTVQDPQSEYEDWIEIYNPGPNAVNLDGLNLTDDLTEPDKWTFPDTLLPAANHLIVWCDSDMVDPGLHANFELSQSGEQVGLFMNLTTCHAVVDSINFPAIQTNNSYGRVCDGSSVWKYFDEPSPGTSNIDKVRNLTISLNGSNVRLFWQSNVCATNYTIYRHSTFPFEPDPSDSIGSTSDTTYLDLGVLLTNSIAFYRVIAQP